MVKTGQLQQISFVAVLLLAVAGFYLDVHVSLSIADWIWYVVPLLLSATVGGRFLPFVLAAFFSGLMLAGYYFSPPPVEPRIALVSRFMGGGVLWLIALVIFLWRRTQTALRKTETHFRSLFENMQEGFAHCRMLYKDGQPQDFIYLAVNRAFEDITGLKQVVGKKVTEVLPGIKQTHPELFQIYGRVAADGRPEKFEFFLESSHAWLDVSAYSPAKDYFVAIFEDITKRKQADEKVRKLSRAVEQSPASIVITNRAGRIEYVNPKFSQVTGYSAEEVLDKNPRFLKSGKMSADEYRQMWKTITAGKEWNGEFHNRKKNGEFCWEYASISPILGQDGEITHFLAVKEDIGERKEMERQLAETLDFNRRIISDMPVGIVLFKASGQCVLANEAAARIVRGTVPQMLQQNFRQMKSWRASGMLEMAEKTLATQSPQEKEVHYVTIFDQEVWLVAHFTHFIRNNESHLLFTLNDIGESRRAEAKIQEQAALLDKARDAIFVLDSEKYVRYWNQGAERIFGWAASEAIGRKIVDLIFRGVMTPQLQTAINSLNRDGEWSGEMNEFTKDGRSVTVQGRSNLIFDEQGRSKGILVIDTDITERKKLEEQVLRAQRMDSLGALAGGIAHDLNNVLTPILISVQLLKDKIKGADEWRMLDSLAANVLRGAKLIQQLLIFGRGVQGERIPVQPRHIAQEVEQIVRETFPKSVKFEIHSAAELWSVTGDPTQIQQVLLNLCVNARDAMSGGGTLSVCLENVTLDEAFVALNPEARPGPYVVISVTDTGTGIPKEIQERIFDPFFTTKECGKGTGLGLSTTLGIIKSHGGFITCRSEKGKGSTFKVYLLACAGPEDQRRVAPGKNSLPRGHDDLLLMVDDEEPILQFAKKTLEQFGYRVLTAANGAEAVSIYKSRQSEIAVVITDMMMPVMDGLATMTALKAINPKVKIIGASGLPANSSVVEIIEPKVPHFISKPYTAETILRILRQVLQPSGSNPTAAGVNESSQLP